MDTAPRVTEKQHDLPKRKKRKPKGPQGQRKPATPVEDAPKKEKKVAPKEEKKNYKMLETTNERRKAYHEMVRLLHTLKIRRVHLLISVSS